MFLKIALHLELLMLISLPWVTLMTKMSLQPFLKFPGETPMFQDRRYLVELNASAVGLAREQAAWRLYLDPQLLSASKGKF